MEGELPLISELRRFWLLDMKSRLVKKERKGGTDEWLSINLIHHAVSPER